MPRFQDIPQFTRSGDYEVDVMLDDIERHVNRFVNEYGLNMCPDFQRGHVWTEEQQIRFVEYFLRGGRSARVIYFNHPGWKTGRDGEFVLVDGLQRLTALLRFVRNEIPVFGHYYRDFTDRPGMSWTMRFNVNDLKTRAEVLQWYIDFNSGGTVHSEEEIARVKALLEVERESQQRVHVSAKEGEEDE